MSSKVRLSRSYLKKRTVLASLALLAILLASGGFLQVNATSSSNISLLASSKVSSTNVAPSAVSTVTKMGTSPALSTIQVSPADNAAIAKAENNAQAEHPGTNGPNLLAAAAHFAPPIVSPSTVVNNGGGAKSAKGLNAYDNGGVDGGLDLEPPDQGLCAGNGYAIDVLNVELQVYSESTFAPLTSDVSLMAIIGFPIAQLFGSSPVGGGYILSDPRCLYDSGTGHWFVSFLYLGGAGVYSASGPFPLGPSTYGAEFVLASTTTSPIGTWNIYAINVTDSVNSGIQSVDTGCPCFGDQPLLGADQNSIAISTNEYPALVAGFNGGQVYLFDKMGMANGFISVNVVRFNTGLLPTPDGTCQPTTGLYCWWSVNPANSPTPGSYDASQKGTEWAVSPLDFINNAVGSSGGDNRIAIWSFSNTASLHSLAPATSLSLSVVHVNRYYDPEFDPKTGAASGMLVPQKAGVHPLGVDIFSNNATIGCAATCPTGKLASNGDGFFGSIVYAQGSIWAAQSTVLNEGSSIARTIVVGVAYYIFNAAGKSISLANQGYIAAQGADLIFPAFGVGPTGRGLITFTLTGHNNFPSTAYAWVSKSTSGTVTIHISAAGQSPADGFSEYQNQAIGGLAYRPRYGDYSYAVWADGRIFFSSEYIQYQNCSPTKFLIDPSCGGTRDPYANWGSSMNSIPS